MGESSPRESGLLVGTSIVRLIVVDVVEGMMWLRARSGWPAMRAMDREIVTARVEIPENHVIPRNNRILTNKYQILTDQFSVRSRWKK